MKTVGDFLESKIRRSESAEQLHLDRGGAPDSEFGALEGHLISQTGQSSFYSAGLVLHGGKRIRYSDMVRVMISDPVNDQRIIPIIGVHGD